MSHFDCGWTFVLCRNRIICFYHQSYVVEIQPVVLSDKQDRHGALKKNGQYYSHSPVG